MSISIILVPLAVAAVAAWEGARQDDSVPGQRICHVGTRMRDETLLIAALRDTRAETSRIGADLIADWHSVRATFQRGTDGVWSAHLTGNVDEEGAMAIVREVDRAYGSQVQQAVVRRLRDQAPAAGMRVESQNVEDDMSVTMVLAVDGSR